jgi:hypothetical protein
VDRDALRLRLRRHLRLYRADVLKGALDGEVATTGFTVNQVFLLLTLLYILGATLMVVLSVTLPPRAGRIANLVVSVVYAVTIIGSCIGETWIYYLLGSGIEVVLLGLIARSAWTWRTTPALPLTERTITTV